MSTMNTVHQQVAGPIVTEHGLHKHTRSPSSNASLPYAHIDEVDFKKTTAILVFKKSNIASKDKVFIDYNDEGGEFVDLMDPRDEDSFTLETFESLMMRARNANKAFILARVTTSQDGGKNSNNAASSAEMGKHLKLFHSHYPAHMLNKILFRTQPEAGLLHRMRCKNPRNNMEIVGNVEYYAIYPHSVDAAIRKYEEARGSHQIKRTSSLQDLARTSTDDLTQEHPSGIPVNLQEAMQSHGIELPKDTEHSLLLAYEAHFLATDDDFLNRADVREFFKKNAVNEDDYLLFTLFRSADPLTIWHVGGGIVDGTPVISNDLRTGNRVPSYKPSWYNLYGVFLPLGESCFTHNTGFINPVAWVLFSIAVLAGLACVLRWLVPKEEWVWVIGVYGLVFFVISCLFVRTTPVNAGMMRHHRDIAEPFVLPPPRRQSNITA